ncbi:MAG TPA: ribosomal protein S18-alanine N-acetyltransferase [Jatrophihabitantaceae bacterium]|jgi:ribosomal-protein-alanine N-acetyltransferase|nr:ribosomal protein S18-alanine N-acetyltransferase [Jatrophihabitantaceae bacterium]
MTADATAGDGVSVVAMLPVHIDALMCFEREMFGAEAWSAQAYREELADRDHRSYVTALDSSGALVGWAGVRVLGADAEVLTVGVVPSARRAGIGRLLLGTLLAHAVERGAEQVFLEVRVDNPAALAMYENDGFARLGIRRGYYENGRVDAVTMRKGLVDERIRR